MKILYFTFQERNENDGIYKKLLYQKKALESLGHNVDFISNQKLKNSIDRIISYYDKKEKILNSFSLKWIKLTRYIYFNDIYNEVIKNKYDILYIRYAQTAMPFFNNFLKKVKRDSKIKIILEIPTYPYDGENLKFKGLKKIKLYLEKLYRKNLYKYIDKIVTFSEDKEIFRIPCINIANGIDLDEVKLINKNEANEYINFISVSAIRYWHGIDRFLYSLLEYKKLGGNEKVKFHIVGEGIDTPKIKKIIEKNKVLEDIVILHGAKQGKDLDAIYNISDIAVGSLGFNRIKLEKGSTLKVREYCAKGLPFIVGYNDISFSNKLLFYYQVLNDETLLDIDQIIRWYKNLKVTPEEIRKYAEENLSWNIQMKKVLKNI